MITRTREEEALYRKTELCDAHREYLRALDERAHACRRVNQQEARFHAAVDALAELAADSK